MRNFYSWKDHLSWNRSLIYFFKAMKQHVFIPFVNARYCRYFEIGARCLESSKVVSANNHQSRHCHGHQRSLAKHADSCKSTWTFPKYNPTKTFMILNSHLLKWNSLRPSDAIWWHRSGSTLAQVMACCLTTPSHYLNQCWLIISEVQWHSYYNLTRDASTINH